MHMTDSAEGLTPCEDQDLLYDVALQVTDDVLGEGSYAYMHRDNGDPRVQAAITRAQRS